MLNRDDILKATDIQIEPVEAWGGTVYVKGMTGKERDRFEASIVHIHGKKQDVNLENVRAKLCVMSMCDENGKRLFADSDAPLLTEKSACELQKVFAVAQRLSGITDEDIDELTEGIKENPFGDSPSD
ncbi:MAG: hypothetical protein A2Y53_04900 [Chloroflexi bacterium RBG_16_47_49]|nr:MAG: hypothetical protein A2Y53_04900 [Chloroflexi bacterium RBG_16_47_49]